MLGAKSLPEYNFFFVDSVKSAVLGLLEELEKEQEKRKPNSIIIGSSDKPEHRISYQLGFLAGLKFAKEKIKQWFADVFEGDTNGKT